MKKGSRRVAALLLVLALITGIFTLAGCEGLEYFTDYPSGWDSDDFWNDYSGDSTTAPTQTTTTTTTTNAWTPTGGNDQPDTSALLSNSVVRDHQTTILGNGNDVVNVMVYMNGSDLESQNAMGTADLKEMLAVSKTGNVNIFVQTLGTKTWHYSGISNRTSQRFLIRDGQMYYLEKDLGAKDVGDPKALAEFISYCDGYYKTNPDSGVKQANRNMLILWDHGGGVIYGYGSDDSKSSYFSTSDSLGIDELQKALVDGGVYFDFIGFDACIMGGLETACALYDFSDYFIASEDFESGYGWEYQRWLEALAANSSISTPELGKIICDDFVTESKQGRSDGILALVDLSYMKLLWSAWTTFAYASESQLQALNYSQQMTSFYQSNYSIQDYQAVDIMAAASTMNTDEAKALQSALSYAMIYMNCTSGDRDMTGLSVTLPYNRQYCTPLVNVLTNCGFDDTYIAFINKFAQSSSSSNYYDWDNYSFGGWDDYTSDYNWDDYSGWGNSMNDWLSLFGWDSYGYGSDSGSGYGSGNNNYGGYGYGDDYGYYNYGDYGYGNGGYGYGDYGYGYGSGNYGNSNNDWYDSYYGSSNDDWYQSDDWGDLYDYFGDLFDW